MFLSFHSQKLPQKLLIANAIANAESCWNLIIWLAGALVSVTYKNLLQSQ